MTQDPKQEQALARQGNRALQRIETVGALSVAFDSAKHIILAPKTVMSGGLPAGMTLSIREVKPEIEDTYWMPKKDKQEMCGLPKTLLMQISDAAGLSWEKPTRTDDRKHPHYCEWTASAIKLALDGSRTPYSDAKCVDLRENAGSGIPGKDFEEMLESAKEANKRAKAKAEQSQSNYKYRERDPMDQIRQARKFISEICLAKAMNRVVANATGIKRAYPKGELKTKTFIIAKLVPDTRDPESKRAVLAEAMGATNAMFGQPQQAPAAVVDAVYEESAPGNNAGNGDEPAGDIPPPPPAGSERPQQQEGQQEDIDFNTGEVMTGTPNVIAILKAAWALANGSGMTPEIFRKLCSDSTGKASKNDMTLADASLVHKSVEAWKNQPKEDGLPV